MNEFEDIEQMLKPQCDFKASSTLKKEVMEKARKEVHQHQTVRLWPWLAAACVAGFVIMFLMPPKSSTEKATGGDNQFVAKIETKTVEEKRQMGNTPEPNNVSNSKTIKRSKVHKKNRPLCVKETKEEPVQMSEETRIELLLASLNVDEPQTEILDTQEEIRQIRMRGERLISMYEENDK
jgi:hypothetical protein